MEALTTAELKAVRRSGGGLHNILASSLIAGLLITLYAGVLQSLAWDWWNDPGYSHGLLIPPLALYIAWTRRHGTLAVPKVPDSRGLAVILAACLVFLTGKLGAEFFLTRVSMVILVAGLIWTFWGIGRLRTLAFPLLLLVTMVPLPVLVYNSVTLPLQLLASHQATSIARLFGVTVQQEGNVIHLAETTLGVAEACSGLRSVSSLTVMALLLGYLQCGRLLTRVALFTLAIPIAIAVNVLRVSATAILADFNAVLAMGFYHMFSGWLVFLVGMGLVYGAATVLHALLDGDR